MNAEIIIDQDHRECLPIASLPEWLQLVRAQVESLKFGTVQVTVHASNVVQIERVEKTRLDRLKRQA
jgi:hypothetical protein